MMSTGSTVLPAVIVVPLAVVTLMVIVAHMILLRCCDDMPLSRRRIRSAGAVVMFITTIVLAHAFGFARFDDPRQFTLSWFSAVMLLMMVLLLAGLDAANNIRLARIDKARIRRAASELHRAIVEATAGKHAGEHGGQSG